MSETKLQQAMADVSRIAQNHFLAHGDPRQALMHGAAFLLRAAAELDPVGRVQCIKCQNPEEMARIARIDALTLTFFDWVEPEDVKNWAIYTCGECGRDLTEDQVEDVR